LSGCGVFVDKRLDFGEMVICVGWSEDNVAGYNDKVARFLKVMKHTQHFFIFFLLRWLNASRAQMTISDC